MGTDGTPTLASSIAGPSIAITLAAAHGGNSSSSPYLPSSSSSSSASMGSENAHASQSHNVIGAQTACLVIALTAVSLRTYTRTIVRPGIFGWEDWLLIASMLAFVLEAACEYRKIHDGNIPHKSTLAFDQISPSLEVNDKSPSNQDGYFSLLAYMATICLVKLSLIAQYCRIFIDRHTRAACRISFAFTALFSVSTITASIFACTPVSAFWHWGAAPTSPRHCIDYYALWYAHGAVNILTDFVILLLPLPALYALKLPWRKKAPSGVLFAFGSFGCVASIVRLYELWWIDSVTGDSTYSDLQSIWCAIELAVCIVCASVTGCPPLYYDRIEPFVDRILGRESRAAAQSRVTRTTVTRSGTRGGTLTTTYVSSYPAPASASPGTSSSSAAMGTQGKQKTTGQAWYVKPLSGWTTAGRKRRHSISSAEDDANFASSAAERSMANVRMGDLTGTPATVTSKVGSYAV